MTNFLKVFERQQGKRDSTVIGSYNNTEQEQPDSLISGERDLRLET
jgi:hypothetical protein